MKTEHTPTPFQSFLAEVHSSNKWSAVPEAEKKVGLFQSFLTEVR